MEKKVRNDRCGLMWLVALQDRQVSRIATFSYRGRFTAHSILPGSPRKGKGIAKGEGADQISRERINLPFTLFSGPGLLQGALGIRYLTLFPVNSVLLSALRTGILRLSTNGSQQSFSWQKIILPRWIHSAWMMRPPASALVIMSPIARMLSRLMWCARPTRVMYDCSPLLLHMTMSIEPFLTMAVNSMTCSPHLLRHLISIPAS